MEFLKRCVLRNPKKCALTGVLSLAIVGIVMAFVFYSFYIARPELLLSVRKMGVPVIAFGYSIWLASFLMGFLLVPKTKADFITYATSDKEVDQSLKIGQAKVRTGEQPDIENETDEILSSYTSEFKRLFVMTILSYLGHMMAVVLFGATFTYLVVHTTVDDHTAIKELDKGSPFLSHVYFSAMTMFTIGFGYNHPVSELIQWGVIVQCFSILLIIIFGLSYLVSFEQNRIDNVRKAILSDLRQALPIGGAAD